jgi:hypothetical protein
MTRIITDSNGRKHITNEPLLHPPQRTWVGLTEDEVFALSNTMPYADRFEFAKAIEDKLKERNT